MYKIKYVSQSKNEIEKNIKLNNQITSISFDNLFLMFENLIQSKSYNSSIQVKIDYHECYQIALIALWKAWKLDNTDYSIYSLFVNQFKWDILAYLKKQNKHRHVKSFEECVYKNKDGEELTLFELIGEDDSSINMIDERLILTKILSKLSKNEKDILLDNVINNKKINEMSKDKNVNYQVLIYKKEKILNKIRVMYSKELYK